MLPRLPRSCLQRQAAIQLSKSSTPAINAARRDASTTTSSCSILSSTNLKQNGTFIKYCLPFSIKFSTNFYRYKSTKLLQKNQNESGKAEAAVDTDTDTDKKRLVKKNSDTDNSLERRVRSLKKPGGELTIQKTPDEEEKSRRRYEKEDPPEEERHRDWKKKPDRAINKALMRTDYFDNMSSQNKENFALAIEIFCERDKHLRGHVEFIYSALKQMKKFGVHKDLDSYKRIIDIFPKGKMIQTNMFQVEFTHYPKHQQCAIDCLEQMEHYSVIPDSEMQQLLTNIFGSWSFPMRKASRMLYWMPKFKNLCPWKLPEPLPDNAMELAKLAVEQMTSADLTTKVTIYNCEELEDAYDMTWIVSGQSSDQQKLIEELPSDRPIYVEGAFRMWMRQTCMNYFILRADPRPKPPPTKIEKDPDDVGSLPTVFEEEFVDMSLAPKSTVHEQDDGIILGLCCTGSSSRDSVVSWIRFLEQSNPRLGKDISVLFTLKSPIGPTDDIEILGYRDLEELQMLGKPRDPFLAESKDRLDIDPGMPDLRQVGVWTESESRFPNWPHNFHTQDSTSMKNKLENERLLEEMERNEQEQKDTMREIGKEEEGNKDSKRLE